MAPNTTTPSMPPGYAFYDLDTLLSDTARHILEDLLQKAKNRNPDVFDMFVYTDFYSCATLDLVDKTLSTVNSKITKKAYEDAYYLLEALTIFNDLEPSWPVCDDHKRVELTNTAYGVLVVTLLQSLEAEGRLNTAHFPGLESFLRNVACWGEQMGRTCSHSNYDSVCKTYGSKLFKDKSKADVALEQARVDEWINGLDVGDQKEVRERRKREAQEKQSLGPWFNHARNVSSDFLLSRTWKAYKKYLQEVPKKPIRGPEWDISKWSAEAKKEFVFDAGSDVFSEEESNEDHTND